MLAISANTKAQYEPSQVGISAKENAKQPPNTVKHCMPESQG